MAEVVIGASIYHLIKATGKSYAFQFTTKKYRLLKETTPLACLTQVQINWYSSHKV